MAKNSAEKVPKNSAEKVPQNSAENDQKFQNQLKVTFATFFRIFHPLCKR